MPNRHVDPVGNEYKGHLLETETYVGGHVEALEAGVFRSDIPTDFKMKPETVQQVSWPRVSKRAALTRRQLIDELDAALRFSIEKEGKLSMDDVTNYDEVKGEIQAMLEVLRDEPIRKDNPLIYHLDVAVMYPNMLSNRLQPHSVVTEADCDMRLQPSRQAVRQEDDVGVARRVLSCQARRGQHDQVCAHQRDVST